MLRRTAAVLISALLISSTVSCDSNLHQNGGNSAAARSAANGGAPGRTSFVYADHLGSPNVIVDEAGAVIHRKKFLPYGEADAGADCGALARDDKTGHCGDSAEDASFAGTREEDGGLLGLGNRFYDPTTGRFAQADPVQVEASKAQTIRAQELDFQLGAEEPGTALEDTLASWSKRLAVAQDLNRFSYVLNNPLSVVDVGGYTGRAVAYWFAKYLEQKKKGPLWKRILAAVVSTIIAIIAIIFAPEAAFAVVKGLIELGVTAAGATATGFGIAYGAALMLVVGGALHNIGSTWYAFSQGASSGQLWQSAGISFALLAFAHIGRIFDALGEISEWAEKFFSGGNAEVLGASAVDDANALASSGNDVVAGEKTTVRIGYHKLGNPPWSDDPYHHAFVHIEGPDGRSFVLRGGPSGQPEGFETILGASSDASGSQASAGAKGWGNLKAMWGPDAKAIEGAPLFKGVKWQVVYATNRPYNDVVMDAVKFAQKIGPAKIPYLPITQNSNTFAFELVETVYGIERPVPRYWVPAWNSKLPFK